MLKWSYFQSQCWMLECCRWHAVLEQHLITTLTSDVNFIVMAKRSIFKMWLWMCERNPTDLQSDAMYAYYAKKNGHFPLLSSSWHTSNEGCSVWTWVLKWISVQTINHSKWIQTEVLLMNFMLNLIELRSDYFYVFASISFIGFVHS